MLCKRPQQSAKARRSPGKKKALRSMGWQRPEAALEEPYVSMLVKFLLTLRDLHFVQVLL
jgi:hypothetical protein